jgi:hypothetical protein
MWEKHNQWIKATQKKTWKEQSKKMNPKMEYDFENQMEVL